MNRWWFQKFKKTLLLKWHHQGFEQCSSGQGAGLPMHGFQVQNQYMAPSVTQIFILLKLIK